MGGWGMGIFDDDTSCDIIEDAIENGATIETLVEKAVSIDGSAYIEYEDCHQIIVSAAMVDSLLNDVNHSNSEEARDWLSRQNADSIIVYKQKLVGLLEKVIGQDSELNELWEENEEDYPEWKGNIQSVITSLSS